MVGVRYWLVVLREEFTRRLINRVAAGRGLGVLADRTNAVIRGLDTVTAEALRVDLERFRRLLDRHLFDKEDLVVPMILEYAGAGLP